MSKNIFLIGIILMMASSLIFYGCSNAPAVPDTKETCSDGIQNQNEAGVDCGGVCNACKTCTDNIMNQGETGIDCGGPCDACPTCSDGAQNQGETAVDCGGPCTPCVVTEPTKPVETEKKYEISDADTVTLDQKLTSITNAAFAKTTALKQSVGDETIFALGFNNLLTQDTYFKVNVTFESARDFNSNPIASNDLEFDESAMMGWLGKNDFSKEYFLKQGGQARVPIVIKVGENYKPSSATKSGEYKFNTNIYYKNEYGVWREYRAPMQISVQVVK
jgi:hypothetical protein